MVGVLTKRLTASPSSLRHSKNSTESWRGAMNSQTRARSPRRGSMLHTTNQIGWRLQPYCDAALIALICVWSRYSATSASSTQRPQDSSVRYGTRATSYCRSMTLLACFEARTCRLSAAFSRRWIKSSRTCCCGAGRVLSSARRGASRSGHERKWVATSVGIILCKEKNRTVVEYALHDAHKPIGVTTYRISLQLPKDLEGQLPSPQEVARLPDTFE